MMRSLYTGVSGLSNHQTRMDVLSNNIANVNTIGYKGSRTIFSDTLSQTMQGATSPQGNVGGINAKQIGLGVKTSSIDILFTKTSFQTTNVNTDLAINNNGFFIVNNGAESYYTRAGNFYFDQQGNFVTNEGLYVQGWMASADGTLNTAAPTGNINIPVSSTMPPRVSTFLNASGTLKADAKLGEANSISQKVYNEQGYAHNVTTTYTKLADNTWLAYSSVDNTVAGTVTGNSKIVTFNPDGSFNNAEDLDLNTIGVIDANGDPTRNPFDDTTIDLNSNARLNDTDSTIVMFVDAAGNVRAVNMTATCTKGDSTGSTGDAEWKLTFTENGKTVGSASYPSAGTALPTITLTDGSQINLGTGTTATINWVSGTTDLNGTAFGTAGNIGLSFQPTNTAGTQPLMTVQTDYSGLLQYAGGFNLNLPTTDGYGAGTLNEKVIDASGTIIGKYSNGQNLSLAQVATAIFNNQQGLERAGSTLFTKSNNSGEPIIGTAGTGGRGTLQAGVLEMSNVDLAEEFTNMIVTQRGYQSNSRIITTSDELLQELINLKR